MVPPPHPARKQTASNRTDILSMNILFSRDLKIPGGRTDENLNFSLLNSEVFSGVPLDPNTGVYLNELSVDERIGYLLIIKT